MTSTTPSEPQLPRSPDRATPSAEELARLHGADAAHADRVRRVAVDLFSAAPAAHGLPLDTAELVGVTAFLHGVGADGRADGRGHGEALILQNGIADLDARDVAVVAQAVGLHQARDETATPVPRAPDAGDSAAGRIAALVSVANALDGGGDHDLAISHVDDTRPAIRVYVQGWRGEAEATSEPCALLRRPLTFAADPGSRYYIRRGDTMQAAAWKVFSRLYSDARSRRDGVRQDADIEDLHKFRVATRRLRAALRAFRPAFGPDALREAYDGARTVARATNGARDLDVFIEALEADAFASRVPTLMARVRSDRAEAIGATRAVVEGQAFDQFCRSMDSLLAGSHPFGGQSGRPKASRRARDEAPRMIGRRLRQVMAFREGMGVADDARRHELRIAAKQFRYVLEFFADVLPARAEAPITKMKALQDSLGDANDCAVQTAYIASATADGSMADVSALERLALELLVTRTELRGERALSLFRSQWEEFAGDAYRRRLADELDR